MRVVVVDPKSLSHFGKEGVIRGERDAARLYRVRFKEERADQNFFAIAMRPADKELAGAVRQQAEDQMMVVYGEWLGRLDKLLGSMERERKAGQAEEDNDRRVKEKARKEKRKKKKGLKKKKV